MRLAGLFVRFDGTENSSVFFFLGGGGANLHLKLHPMGGEIPTLKLMGGDKAHLPLMKLKA